MKRNTEELIEEVSDFLVVYLKAGNVGVNSFIRKAHLDITNLEQLIMIHFLLKNEVKEYVRRLPILIRRFKTTTTSISETYHGEIRGRVDWGATLKKRLEVGYKDRTIFSCTEQSRNYYIKENLVLKAFIGLLNTILDRKTERFMNYGWFAEWNKLKPIIYQIYHHNVYLSRVSLEKVEITDRMLQDTVKHRNPLYRDAAKLFLLYRRLQSKKLNEAEIGSLLKETFVFPDKPEVLFELYWASQIVKHLSQNVKLEVLDGGQNLFASWKDEDFDYRLYHDSIGSGHLSFHIGTNEAREMYNPYIERKIAAMEKTSVIANEVFGESVDTGTLWSGRPDLLLELYRRGSGTLEKVMIGEVKHTTNRSYAIRGLSELLEYMEFVKKRDGRFLSEGPIELKGVLFFDNIPVKQSRVNDVLIINHDHKEMLAQLNDECKSHGS